MNKLYLLATFLALFSTIKAQASNDPTCLFNTTHCSCRQNTTPGSCLRKTSGSPTAASCNVDTCSSGGYACDCLGQLICKIDTCPIWVAKDGTTTSQLTKGSSVDCVQKQDGTCLSKVDVPIEYKMVQFGLPTTYNIAGNMFNMTAFENTNDFIGSRYKMGDNWDRKESLQYRHINMRLYKSPTTEEHLLCAIYNTYGEPNDGLGSIAVTTTLKGLNGQQLEWIVCDDKRECLGKSGNTLTATHGLSFTHTDGWCVKPIEVDSGAISVKFSDVKGFEGVSFQLSDGEDASYFFADGVHGMSGTVDDNMLVQAGGSLPEITFDLAGIQVPQPQVA